MNNRFIPLIILALAACGDDKPADPPAEQPVPGAPRATAGFDQTVFEGDSVTLDGSGSDDPDDDIRSYAWSQLAGPSITLSAADSSVSTFVAPEVTGNAGVVTATFRLTVTDAAGLSSEDFVSVAIADTNQRPMAYASQPQSADALTDVTLEAQSCPTAPCTPSSDPDGTISSYAWRQTGGPQAAIATPAAATTVVTLPDVTAPTFLTFELAITDDGGKSDSASTTVTVHPVAAGLAFAGIAGGDDIVVNATWPAFSVVILNLAGERITAGAASALDIAIELTSGSGQLGGTLSATTVRGAAAFTDLSYDVAENAIGLRASSGTGLEVLLSLDILP